jgi:delta14-sterol reductase
VFGLPILIYSFPFLCNDVSGCPAPSLLHPSTLSLNQLKKEIGWPQDGLNAFFDTQVTMWVLSYYLLSLALYMFLPGQEVEGTELACKGRLQYKFNGNRLESHIGDMM